MTEKEKEGTGDGTEDGSGDVRKRRECSGLDGRRGDGPRESKLAGEDDGDEDTEHGFRRLFNVEAKEGSTGQRKEDAFKSAEDGPHETAGR